MLSIANLLWLALPLALWTGVWKLVSGILLWRNVEHRRKILDELKVKEETEGKGRTVVVGLYHPYSNAGGGGERVLWAALSHMQRTRPNFVYVVYTGGDASKSSILQNVQTRFNIIIDAKTVHFARLSSRWLVEDKTWRAFTLLGQSFGSILMAFEAFSILIPDIFIDTMGYAFSYPLLRSISPAPWPVIGSYTHYPTISSTMIRRVAGREVGYANAGRVARSRLLTRGKVLYYNTLHTLYALSLRHADFLMVNSTWTRNHINKSLSCTSRLTDLLVRIASIFLPPLSMFAGSDRSAQKWAKIVFPPCDMEELAKLPISDEEGRDRKGKTILCLAQFRPEKAHTTQLASLRRLIDLYPAYEYAKDPELKLVLVGGARNDDDFRRVQELKDAAGELGISDKVEIITNAPFPQIVELLGKASVGVNTMIEEHFGIGVVEYMAAGLIPLVHASGGPLHDITPPPAFPDSAPSASLSNKPHPDRTGYHAASPDMFAQCLHTIFTLPEEERRGVRERARKRAVSEFGVGVFENGWESVLDKWTGQLDG